MQENEDGKKEVVGIIHYLRPPPSQLKQRHVGASPERPPQPVRPTVVVNNNTAQSNNTSTPDTAAVTAVAGNDIIN